MGEDGADFWALQGYKVEQWDHFVAFMEAYLSKKGYDYEKIGALVKGVQ